MSATTSPSDKYLFLFKTDSDDLSVVKTALKDYYKYDFLPANTYEATGCLNFVPVYKTLIEKLSGPVPAAPVYAMPDPAGTVPSGETKMNTLVVVISGNADSTGLIDSSLNSLTWSSIRQTLSGIIPQPVGPPKNYPYKLYTEINVVFVSPYCNSFLSEWDTSTPIPNGTLIIPQTVSELIDQPSRELFLSNWARELRLETSTLIDSYGRISFNDIAASVHGGSLASFFRSVGAGVAGKFFPGYCTLGINDGSPDWWESPDIYINTPGNDLYDQDVINTVYINVHTSGTHPVKNFWIGAKHFGSGLGPTDALIVTNITAGGSTLAQVLKAGESCLYHYDQMFLNTTTHRCIVARARFTPIVSTDIDDYSEWSIEANPDEAQRNIDPAGLGKSAGQPPKPEEAQNPDPDPGPDPGDQNFVGDRTLKNIRGFKEHIYWIYNPYKEKKRFRIVPPKEFEQVFKNFNIEFFLITGRNLNDRKPLKIVNTPYVHYLISLDTLEKAEILFSVTAKNKLKTGSELRIPFEILVESGNFRDFIPRKSQFMKLDKNFIPIGGITVKIYIQPRKISGKVLTSERKPVAGARVNIRTINGLQAAVIKTDKEGSFSMPDINPDSYVMYASTKDWYTQNKIVNLFKRDILINFYQSRKNKKSMK